MQTSLGIIIQAVWTDSVAFVRTYDRLVRRGAINRLDGAREKLMGKDLMMFDIGRPGTSNAGKSLNQQMWERMDELMVQIKTGSELDAASAKPEARGLAFALSLTMVPLFRTQKEIAAEALKRYKMKQAGTEYETPCVGSRWRENPVIMRDVHVLGKELPQAIEDNPATTERVVPQAVKTAHRAPSRTTKTATRPASKTVASQGVTQQQREAIQKSGLAADQLASLFKVSLDEIKRIQQEA